MKLQVIHTDKAPAAVGSYSQAINGSIESDLINPSLHTKSLWYD